MSTTLLVCHRDGLVADVIRTALEEEGFAVTVATDLEDALERATSSETLLIDVRITGAFDTVKYLASLPDRPRVLAIVDEKTQEIAAVARAGINGWITTGDSLSQLVSSLKNDDDLVDKRSTTGLKARSGSTPRSKGLLTARETEVLAGLIQGESTKALAARLNVSQATARTHVQNVLAKLGVHSRLQAVAVVIEHSLLSMFDLDDHDEPAAVG